MVIITTMAQNYMLYLEGTLDMKTIALIGAGGPAGRNFKKAVDAGYAELGENIRWRLIDANEYALSLCKKNERKGNQYEYIVSQSFEEALSDGDYDLIHSQPEEGVRYLLQNSSSFKDKIFRHNIFEYDLFADKLKCQYNWRSYMDIPFWVSKVDGITRKSFNKKLNAQPEEKLWVRARKGAGSKAALPVFSFKELKGWESFWRHKDPSVQLVISDYLPGDEFAVQMLWIDGRLVASQARQRVDYLFGKQMPSGQSSTPSVAITCIDQRVYNAAVLAVKFLVRSPNGIYGVDMKKTYSGNLMPTEVNYGRFYTTSHQWIDYKPNPLNIPFDYVRWAMDGTAPETRVNSLPEGIVHVRGLDSAGRLLWK